MQNQQREDDREHEMPSYSVKTAAVVDSNESDNEAVDDNYVVLIEIA